MNNYNEILQYLKINNFFCFTNYTNYTIFCLYFNTYILSFIKINNKFILIQFLDQFRT